MLLALVAALSVFPPASLAGDRQFRAVVERLELHYQKRPMRFMGLLSFVANRVRPAGVKNIRFAVFEDLDSTLQPPDSELDALMQEVAGPEFHPFVRVRSHRDGEQTFVYAREVGRNSELLVVCLERDEACVMKIKVDPEEMSKWIDDPPAMSRKNATRRGERP